MGQEWLTSADGHIWENEMALPLPMMWETHQSEMKPQTTSREHLYGEKGKGFSTFNFKL